MLAKRRQGLVAIAAEIVYEGKTLTLSGNQYRVMCEGERNEKLTTESAAEMKERERKKIM